MSFLAPAEIAETVSAVGEKKGKMSFFAILWPGILAGAYIAFGSLACLTASAGWVGDWAASGLNKAAGAAVFPIGLMLTVIGGAELFTGNNMFLAMSFFDHKTSGLNLIRNWVVVFFTNFIGAMIRVGIVYWGGYLFTDGTLSSFGVKAVAVAETKVGYDWGAAFVRAIGCNWLVCLAVWMATGAKEIISKIFSCFFPIFIFVLCGFEHSVANMFFIPLGILAAKGSVASLTLSNFLFANLIPVTLGNIVGGGIFVAMFYYLAYLRKKKVKE